MRQSLVRHRSGWSLVFATKLLLGSFWFSLTLHAISFDQYHDQAFIANYLRQIALKHPEFATFERLGTSKEGREIAVIILSTGGGQDKPGIYLNATHHGNEKSSTAAALGIIDYIAKNHDQDFISRLLETYAIYVHPLINPDGHARSSRFDSRGRDPNRDYPHPGRTAEASFQLSETRIVQNLLQRRSFIGAAAFHSGIEAILWPWCYSSLPTEDHEIFLKIAKIVADAMEIKKYSQSHQDYQTEGEFIDYAYMEHGIFALTIEVSAAFSPPLQQLPKVVNRSIKGTLAFLAALDELHKESSNAH